MEFFSFRYRRDDSSYEDPRRAFLVRALTLGLFAAGGRALWPQAAVAMGGRPEELPPGQSIYRVRGDVRVSGVDADANTRIGPLDAIETGSDSEIVFVVGKDAFLLRENSRVELSPAAADGGGGGDEGALGESIIGGLRLLSGKLLNVFGVRTADQPLALQTTIATIGVRGTGVYLESRPDRSYVCTCYGSTLLQADADPASREAIVTEYHDSPRFILADGPEGRRIEKAPVINHTDAELVMLETLVGRKPPFWPLGGDY